jgi:hypothetical protein
MATTFVDYEGVVCADWLNQVSRTVEDALGSANTPAQARTALGVIGEAPQDNSIYGRQNGSWVVVSVGGSPTSDYIIKTPIAQENIINPGGAGGAYPLIINAHASQTPTVPLLLVRDSSEDPTFEVFENSVVVTEKAGQADEENLFAILKSDDTPILRVTTGDTTDDNFLILGDDPQTGGIVKIAPGSKARVSVTSHGQVVNGQLLLQCNVEDSPSQTYGLRNLRFYGHKPDAYSGTVDSSVLELTADEEASPSGSEKSIVQIRVNESTSSLNGEVDLASVNRSTGSAASDNVWQVINEGALVGTPGKFSWWYRLGTQNGTRGSFVLRLEDTGKLSASGWSISATGTLAPISDRALKENISDAGSKLNAIRQLKVREFDFRDSGEHQTGFIAQEIEEVFPELVSINDEGHKRYNETQLNRYLLKAVQELADELEGLKNAA